MPVLSSKNAALQFHSDHARATGKVLNTDRDLLLETKGGRIIIWLKRGVLLCRKEHNARTAKLIRTTFYKTR